MNVYIYIYMYVYINECICGYRCSKSWLPTVSDLTGPCLTKVFGRRRASVLARTIGQGLLLHTVFAQTGPSATQGLLLDRSYC